MEADRATAGPHSAGDNAAIQAAMGIGGSEWRSVA
jgi:hypothetical protein